MEIVYCVVALQDMRSSTGPLLSFLCLADDSAAPLQALRVQGPGMASQPRLPCRLLSHAAAPGAVGTAVEVCR